MIKVIPYLEGETFANFAVFEHRKSGIRDILGAGTIQGSFGGRGR